VELAAFGHIEFGQAAVAEGSTLYRAIIR